MTDDIQKRIAEIRERRNTALDVCNESVTVEPSFKMGALRRPLYCDIPWLCAQLEALTRERDAALSDLEDCRDARLEAREKMEL